MGLPGGSNKALLFVDTPYVIFLDADTVLKSDACEQMLRRFQLDDAVAVSGCIGVSNAHESLITELQQLEYMLAMDMGRSFLDKLNALSCLSGAMTMFKTAALRSIGGFAQGSGQDLDVTLRLRRAGYHVGFASLAWSYTQVPATVAALLRQRLRWESDAIRIHVFQHHQLFKQPGFESLGSTLQRMDFIFFSFIPTLLLPLVLLSVWEVSVQYAAVGLWAIYLVMIVVTGTALALLFVGTRARISPYSLLLLPIMPIYMTLFLKVARFYAYAAEIIWHVSSVTPFIPPRVRKLMRRMK